MILSNTAIHEALETSRLIIDPVPTPRFPTPEEPQCPYQTSAVDLRLADEVSVYNEDRAPVHAGFEGTITLEIINLGEYAISLHPRMPICQLIIEEVRGLPARNDGQFQGQTRPIGGS